MNKLKEARKLQRKKDKEWAISIKDRDEGCVICGKVERLNAHHLLPREHKETRHKLWNGISLCPSHHKFSYEISPHKNPMAFFIWMVNNKQRQFYQIVNYVHSEDHSLGGVNPSRSLEGNGELTPRKD